jgi:hypothetical protein
MSRVDPKSKQQMKKVVGVWKGIHNGEKQNIEVRVHKHGLEIEWEDGMKVTVDNAETARLYLERDGAKRGRWKGKRE